MNSNMSMSSNTGRYRVRNPPTHPGLGGSWGPNPLTLYGSGGRTHTPGMQDRFRAAVQPAPLVPHIIEPQVSPDPCLEVEDP